MSLKELPTESMPREKLLQRGPQSLSDAELLAIFLRTGTQGMNVLALADLLLRDFGSLRALFCASKEQFCRHKGLGEAKFVQLQAVLEMTQRYLAETLKRGDALTSPQQTKLYLSSVYPREVVKRALHHNAAAVILAHNHPSGVAEPSQADRRITDRLRDALGLVEIRVLDHFVVGDGEVVSFAERGWI
ncbi:JAB domain-containing protein [Vibrio cholerae]